MQNRRKGQSTLEYITVFAAIVAAIVIFSYSTLKPAVQNMMNASATKINNATSSFTNQ
ncbi:MAG: hypothetical protein Q7J72_03945 [Candidatus Omnitrophota bacterium]|nr:hypothetical protein [Candidatus Omnitrophota bacterium]